MIIKKTSQAKGREIMRLQYAFGSFLQKAATDKDRERSPPKPNPPNTQIKESSPLPWFTIVSKRPSKNTETGKMRASLVSGDVFF